MSSGSCPTMQDAACGVLPSTFPKSPECDNSVRMSPNIRSLNELGKREMGCLEIAAVMNKLARGRQVFHSEADFQHAFAWCIHTTNPAGQVRLEYKPIPNKPVYLDLWLPRIGIAVELKYCTRMLEVDHKHESFALRDQGAQDIRRYDFLKDIQRLEQVCRESAKFRAGFAVLLTNDHLYWRQPSRPHTVDAAFRLHDGRRVTGEMAWSERAASGTTKSREKPIRLYGSYEFQWRDYADIGGARHGKFRYLAVPVSL